MMFNTIMYYFREAATSLIRNSWLSIASVGTIIISLLILGSSLLLVLNVRQVASDVESSLEITVFLEEGLEQDRLDEMEEEIKFVPGVAQVKFVTKEQALEDLKESFGDRAELLSGLEEDNPLPNSYVVKTREAAQVPAAARQLEELEGVEQVRYGQGVVENLLALTHWVRIWGSLALLVLGVAAVLLIATTIRMSVFARRREIGIMKMLGATNTFVRMPFMLEGMIIGLTGGLIAALLINFGYLSLLNKVMFSLPFIQLVDDPETIYRILGGLLGAGFIIGALGSAISLRRFLKV
ncbi:permease-like cell division protein FtsX [Desulfallas thermosapovorans]|uniref:Cell division protein FtsX n=1 Tax=Desulfallas thermosapovorans DSM 6562 TaxID=1121431 RepID=A0A5S4ZPW4_9FIRM|nr:permease-like cell division protein FtsX [Desulfallas thermosapovorans]TYO94819.1 cell division transport system permease protein [Desulfallas thermosapovorans DSM 6562]